MWRVVLPALRPAIAAGVLIVALHVLAKYGTMVQLGRSTLTTKIVAEMLDYGDYRSARSLSLLLGVLSIAVLLATYALTGHSRSQDLESDTFRGRLTAWSCLAGVHPSTTRQVPRSRPPDPVTLAA
ncbi:MAG: hypothetical protein M3Z75_13760 [Actinomycetota bacterium]|nr:hypothetical protein [Actinomycetota bacterium]